MRVVQASLLGFAVAACLSACSQHKDRSAAPAPASQTRADYLDSLERTFTRLDDNGDGVIEAGEIPAQRAALIRARDADHNGVITRDEFVRGGMARFDRLDANHDGVLSQAERAAAKGAGDATAP